MCNINMNKIKLNLYTMPVAFKIVESAMCSSRYSARKKDLLDFVTIFFFSPFFINR